MKVTSMRPTTRALFTRTAIAAVIASGFSAGHVMAQADSAENAAKLDAIEVTGSRIKRADVEGALPVATITRQQIEATGYTTAADVLRAQTFNSFGSYQSTSGNSFSSNTQVDLRGLGAERTLVLIDGRRLPPSPVTGAAGSDLNTIPSAAIERIEILQDGASAIYGSDAIGGVINIILRKDINETIVSGSVGRPTRAGGDENTASLISGKSTDKGRLLFGISWSDREHIALKDRAYHSFFPGDGVNYSTIRGANQVGNSLYGYDSETYFAAPGCAADRIYNNDVDPSGGQYCVFPFADVAWDITDLRQTSLFVNGDQKINDWAAAFFTASYSRVDSFGRFAPVADLVGLSADAAANPLGEDAILFHRFEQLGTRDNSTSNTVLDVHVGLNLDVQGIPVQVGVRQSRYNSNDIGRNYTNRSIASQYLADGTYNPYDLSQNSEAVLNKMKLTIGREGFYKYQEAYANANFSFGQLPGGAMQLAVGAETRDDTFSDIYDAASVAGIVGGSAGSSAAGHRSANAGFAEVLLPVLNNLEISAAGRYDDYSDFGSATTGKVSLRYQPIDSLTLRGSYGKGFRAPTLSDMYGALSSDAPSVRDFTTCRAAGVADTDCASRQVSTGVAADGTVLGGFQGSNPDLDAEKSKQYSVGFVFAPTSAFDLSLDYYNIRLSNAVQFVSYQELVRREADGQGLPAGTSIVRRTNADGSPGSILSITTGPANVGTVKTSGLDLNIGTHFELGFGQLRSGLQASYVIEYVDSENKPGQDQVGDPGVPEYRVMMMNSLRMGAFAFNYNINHIADTSAITQPDGTGKEQQVGHVASFTSHDFQVVWYAPTRTELTLGVRNAFDRGPSLNFIGEDNPYYDSTVYDPFGRVPYLSIKQTF
ncbi:TonB-dependent siderophore receptor [Sinimarinibacterium sp. NLF-5-8]|uniref:TonB-dependent receptor plug domain-containing protein n=1 Tax=Sinimarinibacterium sp. NLF-5-8 TaxID=2698684 RepID=UPI00137B97D4|nr:TonB-dependent receptor [Sinimarinibacterium sp. NLF-5-8]QHS08770.1 TonB-dependent receptor [Sinimarinibacterium sp. NLF-5-8]